MKNFKTTLFIVLIFLFCPCAQAQNIGVVFSSGFKYYRTVWDACNKDINQNNKILEYNLSTIDGNTVLKKIEGDNSELIVAIGKKAAELLRGKTSKAVIFTMVFDSGRYKDKNYTGVSIDIPDNIKIDNMKKIFPGKNRIGLVYSPALEQKYKELLNTCSASGFQVVARKVDSEKQFGASVEGLMKETDYFLILPDPSLFYGQNIKFLFLVSLKYKVPVIGISSSFTKLGALASFECDYEDIGKQTGEIVNMILQGKLPSEIMPLKPRKVKISLNLMTARKTDVNISSEMIKQADSVFDQ